MSAVAPERPGDVARVGAGVPRPLDALARTRPEVRRRSNLALLTVFWIYVTVSDILWGNSMQASLASIGVNHVFAAWNARLGQHLILYPALIASMWVTRQIGWQPLWRSAPLQIACGVAFAALANPAMELSERFFMWYSWHDRAAAAASAMSAVGYPGQPGYLWIASAVSFLVDYAFCLALLAGFEFYRRYRDSQLRSEALERSLGAAHLAALRMQLSPHTLFNLLHTIRGHVTWDPVLAQSMIVQLGDLLRRALQAGEHELSRLHDELEFASLYLQLQRRRFDDRLTVEVPAAGSIPPVWVPSLILQPLVENAVVHGLAHPQGAVTVRVQVRVEDETLILQVANTLRVGDAGVGIAHAGIGLKNVRERLAIQFNGSASLQAGRDGSGDWVAQIRMPMLHQGR